MFWKHQATTSILERNVWLIRGVTWLVGDLGRGRGTKCEHVRLYVHWPSSWSEVAVKEGDHIRVKRGKWAKKGQKEAWHFFAPITYQASFCPTSSAVSKIGRKEAWAKKGQKKRVNGAPHCNHTVTLSGVTINDHTNLDDSTQEGRGGTVILGGGVGGGWLHGRVWNGRDIVTDCSFENWKAERLSWVSIIASLGPVLMSLRYPACLPALCRGCGARETGNVVNTIKLYNLHECWLGQFA